MDAALSLGHPTHVLRWAHEARLTRLANVPSAASRCVIDKRKFMVCGVFAWSWSDDCSALETWGHFLVLLMSSAICSGRRRSWLRAGGVAGFRGKSKRCGVQMKAARKGPRAAPGYDSGGDGFEGIEDFGEDDMGEEYDETEEEVEQVESVPALKGSERTPPKGPQGGRIEGGGEAYSLVAIRIVTGRRHQIRVHTAHIGHPTVTDGRYTAKPTFLKDRQWCPRNFLHRYRLAFRDGAGKQREAMAPLPLDLTTALGHLVPKDKESAKQFNLWKEGKGHQDWEKYEVLRPPYESPKKKKALAERNDEQGASVEWICPGCGAKNYGPPPRAEARAWSAPKSGYLCYRCGALKPDDEPDKK